MWFAGIVPSDTPFKNLTEDPPPGVGPYHDHRVGAEPPVRAGEEPRVRGARASPRSRCRRLDKITTQIIKNASQQAQDVLDNKLDYMQDPPPADLKPTVIEQADDRYEEFATSSTYYSFMNTQDRPVRRPAGPRGGQLRDRQAGAGAPVRGRARPGLLVPARPASPATTRRSTPPSARTAIRHSRPTSPRRRT